MASVNSIRRIAQFASALGCGLAFALAVKSDQAVACAGIEQSIAELTTFDPAVLGDDLWSGLAFDPFDSSYGGSCEPCLAKAMLDDWHGFLGDAVTSADWEQVLMKASLADIFAIEQRLAGKAKAPPKGYETSSLWRSPDAAPQLASAVEFVELLKRMEPQVTFEIWSNKPRAAADTTLGKELAAAQHGLKAATTPFLRQRYAFAVLRARFYRHEWKDAIAFYDANLATLSAPSADLTWRARYYIAGAARHDDKPSRANLELARIFAGYQPLTGLAMLDFRPVDDKEWQATLGLAKDPKEKAALWSMVGIKHDPLVGAQEILKLDPTSALVPLLVVRELSHVESIGGWQDERADDAELAARQQGLARIEALATKLAAAPKSAKRYVYELVLAHLAMRRGDVDHTRVHGQQAVAMAPHDVRVASQAKASLALAMVAKWKIDPRAERELATTLREVDPSFGRLRSVSDQIRGKLALAYAAANRMIDAEFLAQGIGSFDNREGLGEQITTSWWSASTLESLIRRSQQNTSEFDHFVLAGSHTTADLQHELAIRRVLDGDFAGAKKMFSMSTERLRTDPFVMHIVDCHDCDHDKFGETATWTAQNLLDRLIELDAVAKQGGERGADAALALGNAMYNITENGNARSFTTNTHQLTLDATVAERYYKLAHDSTGKRELKAKAAWLAAKAELGTLFWQAQRTGTADTEIDYGKVVPTTWYQTFKKYADTKYYKEVLKECGRFRTWAAHAP